MNFWIKWGEVEKFKVEVCTFIEVIIKYDNKLFSK